MRLAESITAINSLLEEHLPWLTTYRFAAKASINDDIGYMIEKENKERESVMPSDVRTPISYFLMSSSKAIRPMGERALAIYNSEKVRYDIRQVFIINIDDVEDADESLFADRVELCREKILDVYINKQSGTGFHIEKMEEDLENVFYDVDYDEYKSMRYPYIYFSLNLSVVAEVSCI